MTVAPAVRAYAPRANSDGPPVPVVETIVELPLANVTVPRVWLVVVLAVLLPLKVNVPPLKVSAAVVVRRLVWLPAATGI